MAIYIKFDALQGDVTQKQYKGYSSVNSMHLTSIHSGAKNITGSQSYHQGGAPQFSPIQIIKSVDAITPYVSAAACNGHVFKEVTVVEVRAHADKTMTPFLVTTLKNVRIAGYSRIHQEQGVQAKEMLRLTYSQIAERHVGRNVDGSLQGAKVVGFDLETVRGL